MAEHGFAGDEDTLVRQIEEMRRLLRLMNDATPPEAAAALEHDPEKWMPAFRKNHALPRN